MHTRSLRLLMVCASQVSKWRSKGGDDVVDSLKKLTRISKSTEQRDHAPAAAWNSRMDSLLPDLEQITSARLARVMHCCRVAGYWNGDLFVGMVGGAMAKPGVIMGVRPIELGMIVQSFGMIAREQRKKGNREALEFFDLTGGLFMGRLMEACIEKGMFEDGKWRGSINARMLSNTIHGLGLCWENVPSFREGEGARFVRASIQKMLAALMEIEKTMCPMDFSNCVHGCVNDADLLREMFGSLMRCLVMRPSEFCPQQLSNITWGIGKLGYKDHGLLNVLAGFFLSGLGNFKEQHLANILQSFGLVGYRNEKLLSVCESEILTRLENQPGKFWEQHLASIAHSLGSLGFSQKRNEKLLVALGKEVSKISRVANFNDQHLANIVYGFGKCRFFRGRVLTRLLSASGKKLGKFSPQGLVNLVYGVALVQDSATAAMSDILVGFLEEICIEVEKRGAKSLNEQEICTLCWSMGELRFYDKQVVNSLILEYMTKQRHGMMTNPEADVTADPVTHSREEKSEGMRTVLAACAALGIQNDSYIERFRNQIFLDLNEGKGGIRGATFSLWSMAVLGVLSDQDFDQFCKHIDGFLAKGEVLGVEGSMQFIQGWLYVSLTGGPSNPASHAWQHLIDSAKEKCVQGTVESRFEKTIQSYLEEKGVGFRLDVRLVEGLLPVDIFIPDNVGGGIVVECDGLYHYTINKIEGKPRQIGVTLFRNQILLAAGYKVLCLPYFMGESEKKASLMKMIESMTLSR
ncbi:hypothetical protein BSKO_11914 [Bryopsis sp. KO-2023]|nr:hypothetical protein BSKO_11914 [Bryopsis sp. KO-2023]